MILGLGEDLVEIARLKKTLARFGDRFLARCFTKIERSYCERKKNCLPCYAKRFAAKEACVKALGTGFRQGISWRDISVILMAMGQPGIQLTGNARARLDSMNPPHMQARIMLTLTSEPSYAHATVLITTEKYIF